MTAVFLRELSSYFISPIGYVYLAAFYALAGYEYSIIILSGQADLSYEFSFLYTIVLLLTPILTMRLMSEDRKQKTEAVLFSSPVSTGGIVIGKFLSASAVYLMGIGITAVHAIVLSSGADVNWTTFAGNFVGVAVMGMAGIAVGMFISAQTENQIIAAIGGFASMLFVISLNSLADVVAFEPLEKVLYGLSFYTKYYNLTMGIFRVSDFVFFFSFAAVFIILTVCVLEKRKQKTGVLAGAIVAAGLCVIIGANVVAGLLTEKYGWSLDLTANDRYAISEDSIRTIKKLDDEVKITVLVDEEDMETGSYYIVQAYQNLKQYAKYSDKIKLEFVDVIENPTFVSQYADLDLAAYDILVESTEGNEVLSFQNLYEYDSSGYSITASKVEQMVTNAILKVTSSEKKVVTVLGGYGDTAPEELMDLLEANRYEVVRQSLLTDDLSPEAESAVIYAPQRDLEADSVRKLSDWLDNDGKQGRNLFVFLDPNRTGLTNLEAFLAEWGISTGKGYAFESDSSKYYERFYYPVAQYVDAEYAEGMTKNDVMIMALCRPLDTIFEEKDNYTTKVLLGFSETSGAVELGDTEVTNDLITGGVKGMILSSHDWYGTEVTTSNVVVSGSALAFTGSIISGNTFANSEYILGVFRRLSGQKDSVSIPVKDLTVQNHSITSAGVNVQTWVFMIILPAVVLAAGIVVWFRRRHK